MPWNISEVFGHRHAIEHYCHPTLVKYHFTETTLAWYQCLRGCDIFGYSILITIQFYDGPFQKKIYLYGIAINYQYFVISHVIWNSTWPHYTQRAVILPTYYCNPTFCHVIAVSNKVSFMVSVISPVPLTHCVQYIPRNMHTVLLCFALLRLCNRS